MALAPIRYGETTKDYTEEDHLGQSSLDWEEDDTSAPDHLSYLITFQLEKW